MVLGKVGGDDERSENEIPQEREREKRERADRPTMEREAGDIVSGSLPSLRPPVPQGLMISGMNEEGIDAYDPTLLITASMQSPLAGDSDALRHSFATSITTSMPIIDRGGNGKGSPLKRGGTTGSGMHMQGDHAEGGGEEGGGNGKGGGRMRTASFSKTLRVAREKNGVKLEQDYKQMLLLRENNLY